MKDILDSECYRAKDIANNARCKDPMTFEQEYPEEVTFKEPYPGYYKDGGLRSKVPEINYKMLAAVGWALNHPGRFLTIRLQDIPTAEDAISQARSLQDRIKSIKLEGLNACCGVQVDYQTEFFITVQYLPEEVFDLTDRTVKWANIRLSKGDS